MAQFGELLSELRKDKGLTLEEVADIFPVSIATISNYENGKHLPDLQKLCVLADYFGVSTDYLLGRISVNLSPDSLNAPFIDGKTIGDIIVMLKKLDPERRRTLLKLLTDMDVSTTIDKLGKKTAK